MIDLHSHILYGIDDGSKNKEMTLEMLKIAQNDGIRSIVATPHYISGANKYDKEILNNQFIEAISLIKNNNINIDLKLGNELFLDEFIVDNLKKGKCNTIEGTKYVLIELPMIGIPIYTENVICDLISSRYKPILVHPERYIEIQEDPNILIKYIELGCVTQINSTSINGIGGKKVQETSKLIIENNMGHLVASDSHSNRTRSPKLKEVYEIVTSWIGKEKANKIFFENPKKILKDEDLDVEEPTCIQIKKSIIYKIKSIFK